MRYEAQGIVSVELRPIDAGSDVPPFEPGSHIDVHLPNGLVRSYSLCNPSTDRKRYVIGVLNDRKSRGGSRYIHEQLRVGAILKISAPRNNFALVDSAHSVLVAGGIGITPIWSMLQKLVADERSVELLYFARSRQEAAFLPAISALCGTRVQCRLQFDDEHGGQPDLAAALADKGTDSNYYCCGPVPMLDAFEQACEALNYRNAHIERFSAAPAQETSAGDACTVRLAKSCLTLEVPAGTSILDAMLNAGIQHEHSCKEGVCGSCEARILEGVADHRDGVLSKREREAGLTMMPCVSRCKRGPLVLDI